MDGEYSHSHTILLGTYMGILFLESNLEIPIKINNSIFRSLGYEHTCKNMPNTC